MSVLAIADDLSGAAETAAALMGFQSLSAQNAHFPSRAAATLELYSDAVTPQPSSLPIRVIDSDNRHLVPSRAAARTRTLLSGKAAPPGSIYLKFDSLMRGNISAELAAAMDVRPVVFCPALPVLRRTVLNGILQIDGVPLHRTRLWQAESRAPGHSIMEQLGLPCTVVPLETVRSSSLACVLQGIADAGRLAVCDAESGADLDFIASSAVRHDLVLAGAAGLAAALARQLPAGSSPSSTSGDATVRSADVLFILGTASPTVTNQLVELRALGIPVHHVQPADIAGFSIPDSSGTVAIVVDGAIDASQSGFIVRSLADLALRLHTNRHLVLSGGETARAVLDALHIDRLYPLAQAHPGAVVSVTDDGRLIATRPGSHGDDHSLTQILTTINALQITNPRKALL